ncbi:hypothetical protein [Salibaculum halophilum]|uniref:hypothetical protein n=1 Tax=Salibaculum halophilum TaxID=1914408 RepID=UPI000A11A60A|nr:hypothetical protein [Salibaculum halophilum]
MVGTSKILTVSYGTFSCTLEGFDDSFNTMKAIAEYFRDLASDDRYFGAEPPTPDAEMLARIAEKEISRRVEARAEDDGIVLRPALSRPDAEAPASPERPGLDAAAAPGETSSTAIAAAVSAAAAAPSRRAPADGPASADQPPAAPQEPETPPEADASGDQDEQADDTQAAVHDDDSAEATDTGQPDTPPTATGQPAETDPPEDADTPPSAAARQTEELPVKSLAEAPAHPDANSVAAKLQRIRAVVGRDTAEVSGSDYTEDQGGTDAAQMGHLPDITDPAATPATDTEKAVTATPEAEAADPPVERAYHRLEEGIDGLVEAPADATPATPQEDSPAASDTDPDPAGHDAGDDAPAAPDLAMLDGADELDQYLGAQGDADLSPEEEADLLEAVSGDTDTAAEAATGAGAVGGDDNTAAEAETGADANTGPEVDADAAIDAGAGEDPATGEETATAQPRGFAATPEEDEDALARLLDETDAQMKEPEGNRRRAAIAQLKAAVAATQAEGPTGQAGNRSDTGEVENAFREDLDEVVRPRRAPRPDQARRGAQSERPRPAPLKLVASQRVDLNNEGAEAETTPDQPVQPVRPRRVQARTRAEGTGTEGFADFADRMGARDLPDLLEAAAAYTAFVEGAEEFSRPQIIRRVRQVAPPGFNREDGLRSFADLLREGRLNKVRNGRFQIAEDTRFHPQRQAS